MSRWLVFLLLALWSTHSFSQREADVEGASIAVDEERQRIQSDRESLELHFEHDEAACYNKFAVTDCLRELRLQRRQSLDDLRRKTIVLNDIERKKRTLSKMERMELKSSLDKVD